MREIRVDLIHLPSQGTGQTVYSKNLAKELENLADLQIINPTDNSIFNFLNYFNNSLAIKALPFLIKKKIRKNSLVHITNHELFFILSKIKNKKIVTLCDLSLYSYYKTWKKKDVKLLEKTEKIICISNSTKNELLNDFSFLEKKTRVIHLGTEKLNKNNLDIRKKYGIPEEKKIILFVGSDDQKKNFISLLKAFSELNEENLVLVKIGFSYTFSGENERKKFQNFIQKNNLQNKVKFLDFISRQDLIDFYFESFVFVQPSLHEGFGLTLLEAMNCSCPVLCSDIPPFREVAGNSALFFNPKNKKELNEKLSIIFKDKNLRKNLIKAGSENIKKFNWKKTAMKTLEVYKEALNKT